MSTLGLIIPNMGPMEWLIIAGLGLLIFGRRLPEVGRSLGKGIVEFRKGLKGIEDDVEAETNRPSSASQRPLPQSEPAMNAPMQASAAGQGPVDVRVSRADRVD